MGCIVIQEDVYRVHDCVYVCGTKQTIYTVMLHLNNASSGLYCVCLFMHEYYYTSLLLSLLLQDHWSMCDQFPHGFLSVQLSMPVQE